mgnify:CR=1 FL=1
MRAISSCSAKPAIPPEPKAERSPGGLRFFPPEADDSVGSSNLPERLPASGRERDSNESCMSEKALRYASVNSSGRGVSRTSTGIEISLRRGSVEIICISSIFLLVRILLNSKML